MDKLTLCAIFSDGCVLQRNKEIKIWGGGQNGAEVTVSLCGESVIAVVENGKWLARVPAIPAVESCNLVVTSGKDKLTIKDIAIGEVWIAGGQSNMEMSMMFDADAQSETDTNLNFRFFDVPRISYEGQEKDEDYSEFGFWRRCDKENIPYFSAVSYYFGKILQKSLNVPIGIVGCNYGGTSASCWMPEEDLQSDAELKRYLEDYRNSLLGIDIEQCNKNFLNERKLYQEPEIIEYFSMLSKGGYTLAQIEEYISNHPVVKQIINKSPLIGPMHPYRPASLYHTMLKKIAPYSTRGMIWYQGESDEGKAEMYAKLFETMIKRWRQTWQDNLSFLFVQLAPFGRWLDDSGKNYPAVREQQEQVSKNVPGAYMASIMDCGEQYDIHPKRKRPVGERLARLALGKVYGLDVPCEPPEAVSCTADEHGVKINFINCGNGLSLRGKRINGLQVFGNGHEIMDYDINISSDTVTIICCESIREVRFAWLDYVDANLYGNDGLCAKPFKLKTT
ncbi:MAG: sialate O-acetylesterase [Oscillospiraceae bacterium]|nr:sialate O-acetylesterase [Oscillospiraceae bacterium]